MSSLQDTFKPVNVAKARGRLGEEEDVIGKSAEALSTPTWAAPISREPSVVEETPVTEEPVVEEVPAWAQPVQQRAQEEVPAWAQVVEPSMSAAVGDSGTAFNGLLPSGVEPGSYSENDLIERPELYNPIFDFVKDRYGRSAVSNKDRAEVVEMFLENRRGNAAGNSVRAISEADYLMDAKENPEAMLKVGKAYAIYEGMAGLFSSEATWAETGSGVADYLSTTLLDPINLVGGIVGKAVGGTAIRTGTKTAQTIAQKEVAKQLIKGASREVAKKAGTSVLKKAGAAAAVEGAQEVAEFSAKMAANKGIQRVLTKAGLKEIAATTAVDAVANAGTEFLYQRSLLETGVQDEISKGAVGIAALSAMAMGGIQAGVVAKRGFTNTALVSETVQKADPKKIAADLEKSLREWADQAPEGEVAWLTKVKNGEQITPEDTDFFIDLLLGRTGKETAEEGAEEAPRLRGLAEIMHEGGYFYVKRTDDDTMSNWISDFMREELDQDAIDSLVGTVGIPKGQMTVEAFSDAFANRMNESARMMNSVGQVAKRLDTNLKDLNLNDFMEEALGHNLIADIVPQAERFKGKGAFLANVTESQNKFIRSLVSHPSTSMLNLVGYSGAASIDAATDITMALYKGNVGILKSVLKGADSGKSELFVAKQLLLSVKDRVKFAMDPDMTHAAFKSALLRSTGGLDTLDRTLAGGIDVVQSVDAMSRMGGKAGRVQGNLDTWINGVQHATFVHAQDSFTKSQEYVSQMNKMLRTKFGKEWNEFYSDPNAIKIMATKEYKQLELDAVMRTQENIFSKSYKDNSKLGQVAGMIEDARNIPGLGFMIPFGKFFNNTIDFGIKHTPLLNIAAKKTGKYADKSFLELNARGAVAAGLVYGMAQDEDENRRNGLGLYDELVDGVVISQQYDYPISLFKAASRVAAYNMAGEDVPAEIITQIGKDFGGGGLTRNLNKTTAEFADFGAALLAGELKQAGVEGITIASDITAQALSGFLRPYQPIDTAIGLATGANQRPKDVAQGNKFVGNSLRYIDTTTSFLLGKSDPPKVSSATGEMDQMSTAAFGGARTPMLTNLQRVMNVVGVDQWGLNSGLSKDKKGMIPEAVNEYQRQVYLAMEDWAAAKMNNEAFLKAPGDVQKMHYEDQVKKVRKEAMFMLVARYNGPQDTLGAQYDIMSKHSVEAVKEALTELELGDDLGALNLAQVSIVRSQLETADFIKRMEAPAATYD